ncbi:hypothetical protein [Actinotalea fermentans]|uniref:CHAT domain-containing protein n=1 Tax=Actinotalea fermentans TaxID=43671 RepID=A0A511YYY3_9CELL|nr:hypothetical protein [Actinotalea fermentans]GEN80408.1 hypothetical protein AFE02nite_21420 [Actinotalea fermentans]
MRLRVGVVGVDARGAAAVAAAAGHADLLAVKPLPAGVQLLLTPAALLDDAARGGTRARFVVVLGDPAGLDPAAVAAAADALGADLVVARWSPARDDHGGPDHAPGDPDDAGAVLRGVVDALVGGAVLGDAFLAGLGAVTPLIGDASLLSWTDLGALLDPFGGRGAGAEPPEAAAPPETAPPDDAAPPPPPAPPSPPPPPPRARPRRRTPAPAPPPHEPAPAPAPEPPPPGTDDRWLQCTVAPDARAARSAERAGTPLPAHAVTEGRNRVTVFVGPAEAGALRAGDLTDAELGFTSPDVESVRLTAVLVPLHPRGEPSRATLRVPRVGRSSDAVLRLDVPAGTREVSARLLLVHRNRVLQTAVLSGAVGGSATLTELALVRPGLAGLRDRRRFDATVVANHDAAGRAGLMGHRDGRTTSVEVAAMREIEPVLGRLRSLLISAAYLPTRRPTRADDGVPRHAWTRREVDLLVELAVHGRDLHGFLEAALLPFGAELKRLQVVTARTGAFLPLELAYTRPAPDPDAGICPSWAAGGSACGPGCGAGPDDTSIVCPAAFLGLSATIERHYVDGPQSADGRQYLTTAAPVRGRSRLTVTRGALGASSTVAAKDVAAALAALAAVDPGVRRAGTWQEWTTALAAADTDLLVLVPHADVQRATLEISTATLARGRIEARHVTGGRDVRPVVLLLGCDTAGSAEDPAGFATRFLARDAAVVVASLTMLGTGHAARLAGRLVTDLRAAAGDRRRTPVGDLVTACRRAAVADGLIAALAVAAYGDADWTI